jgi:hypothetical protein
MLDNLVGAFSETGSKAEGALRSFTNPNKPGAPRAPQPAPPQYAPQLYAPQQQPYAPAAHVYSGYGQQAYQPAPPVYAGLSSSLLYGGSYGGSLAGGSVADGDSYTPSIAIGEVAPVVQRAGAPPRLRSVNARFTQKTRFAAPIAYRRLRLAAAARKASSGSALSSPSNASTCRPRPPS